MKNISSEQDELLRYKPYCEIVIDGKSIEDIHDRIQLFDKYSKEKPINSFEYEMIIRDDIETQLFENREEIKNFNNKTKVLRRSIINKM